MTTPHLPASFPRTRMRRNRTHPWIRNLVQENRVSAQDLIWPCFVIDGTGREAIMALPGVERLSIPLLVEAAQKAAALGIPAIAVFPVISNDLKDEDGTEATNPNNLVCRAVRAIKAAVPNLGIICDVALDPFTSHAHDGLVRDGKLVNDATVAVLCKMAVIQAEAGCDIIAPSDMMDGRIGQVRDALDAAGFEDVKIMSYAAKYASAFYGPFREALNNKDFLKKSALHDKRTYQMDPANSDEAIREVALDIQEGADMVMVKPGMPYLDVLYRVKSSFAVPTFAYQVSGEYAMLKAAGQNGWLDGDLVMMESLLAFKRAGADGILTYAALDIAERLAKA
jgi:porphobilinogen synthase